MRACSVQRQVCGSTLIDSRSKLEQLAALLSVDAATLKLTRLFSTSVNGWNPATFHALCDNQGATLTLVQCPSGTYGGYASINWNSHTGAESDPSFSAANLPALGSTRSFRAVAMVGKFFRLPNMGLVSASSTTFSPSTAAATTLSARKPMAALPPSALPAHSCPDRLQNLPKTVSLRFYKWVTSTWPKGSASIPGLLAFHGRAM